MASNHLYANLPQSNDFAPAINSLDIKSLIASYLSKINTSPTYSDPKYQPEVGDYQEAQYQEEVQQQYYSPSQSYQQQAQYNTPSGYNNYQSQQTEIYQSQSYEPAVTKTTFDIVKSVERQPETYHYQNQYQAQQYLPTKQPSQELLTHENYPAKTHTRVIFKTPEGKSTLLKKRVI